MEKLLAYKQDHYITQQITNIENSANFYFNNFYERYKSLDFLPEMTTDDFSNFMQTPKAFFLLKLTGGQTLNVGPLALNSEKVFELLERPAEVDKLISDIEALERDKHYRNEHAQNIHHFEIISNSLKIKQSRIDQITEQNSFYITKETQFQAIQMIEEILPKINELMKICDVSKLPKTSDDPFSAVFLGLESLFKGKGSGMERVYEIDLISIQRAF